jgi:repressor LexA
MTRPSDIPSQAYGLTPIQAEVLEFIKQQQAQRHPSPSYDEIGAAVGLASKSGVHRVVQQLKERNAIAMLPGRARSITIVGRV